MKHLDDNGLLYLIQKIKTWDNDKVDKVNGKGLSTNDYTNEEKAKVAAAQSASDVESAITGKGYQTAAQVQSAITSAMAGISGIDFSIVSDFASLPATGAKGIIYLVPNSGSGNNSYDEYVWITIGTGQDATSRYEKIGTTEVDLSGYVQTSDLSAITNAEIDTIITNANS